jgi:DUF2971 family protein
MIFNKIKLYSEEETPPPIYHYTSQHGLLEIIKTKSLWATNIYYLNDSSEYEYASNLMLNELNNYMVSITPAEPPIVPAIIPEGFIEKDDLSEFSFLQECRDVLMDISDSVETYISSFSEKGDLLSQWRGYCPQGNGFSIAFDTKKMIEQLKKYGFEICQCTYKPEEQKEIANCLITDLCKKWKSLPKKNDENARRQLIVDFMIDFFSIAPRLKHKSFKEEREWRFCLFFEQERKKLRIKYREGASMVIPYVAIPLSENEKDIPIKEIIIGPTLHKELSRNALRDFMSSEGFTTVKIKFSDIPFRNL